MKASAIGVDLGGTLCKIGLVDEVGQSLTERSFETPETPEAVVERIAETVRGLLPGASVREAIGVGAPGPVLVPEGVIERAPNLGWEAVAFGPMLSDALDLDAIVENDASVAALGEHWVGAAAGADVLLAVTLGTGVGGGIVADGAIFHGACGRSAEIGHLVVEPGGPPCACGKRGCVESYFSARAFRLAARDTLGPGAGTEAVFAAYRQGQPRIIEAVDRATERLAQGIAAAVVLFDPSAVVVTGGVTGSWDVFGSRLVTATRRDVGPAGPEPSIDRSTLGERAGVVGAARLAIDAAGAL